MKKYLVISVINKTIDTFCLRVERPKTKIRSGQCFNLGIPGVDINREYSMYSGEDDEYLEFLIRAVKGGLLSNKLKNLTAGDEVEIDGPYGEFTLNPENLNSKFIFIGSGTGIAPFRSFIKSHNVQNYKILHGIRYAYENYDYGDYKIGAYIPCISKNDNGVRMRVTDYLRLNPVSLDSKVYLCGNRNMIIESVELILSQGLSSNQIISEVFF